MLKCGPDALRWRPGEPSTCGLKCSPSVNIVTLLPLDRRPWRPQGAVGKVCRWQEYRCVVVYCVQVLAHPVRSFNVSSFEHVCRGRHNLPCLRVRYDRALRPLFSLINNGLPAVSCCRYLAPLCAPAVLLGHRRTT